MRNSMVAVFLSMLSLAAILPVSAEGTCAKWFRLTLKEKYRIKSSASNLRLAEFALYDRDGVQQGRGLTAVDAATEPSAMAEGTCLVQTPYSVAVGPACLFDGAYSGDSTSNFSINGIPVDGDGYPAMSVSDSSTWTKVVARLPSSASPVVSYQLFVGYYNWSGNERSASRWTLEASYDGVNWFAVDDHSAKDATKPANNNSPYNGGVAYAVGASEIQEVAVDSGDVQVLPGGFYGADVRVVKTGNGTVAAVGRVGDAAIRVSEGTLAMKGVSFMRYRFKIDRVRGTNQHMEISEFKLMNGGVDVTQGFVSVSNCAVADGGGGSPSGEGPAKAVDGKTSTKFLDRFSASATSVSNCWLEIVYSEPRAIDAYNWASGLNNYWSGNDSRMPVAWRLQGSDDGVAWYDLDVRSTPSFSPTYSASTWQSADGFTCAGTSAGGMATVAEGAVMSVSGEVGLRGVVNAGVVALSAGAAAVFSPAAGEVQVASGGGISGAGGVTKSGDGTLEMDGANSYSGDTVVESGTLRIGRGAAVSAKWFRLVLKKKYSWVKSSASLLRLSEWALYDSNGTQQNMSLKACDPSLPDRRMGPGTCKVSCAYAVANTNALFDGEYVGSSTKDLYVSGLPTDANGYPAMSVGDSATWITVTIRLAEGAAPVTGYNLFVGYYNWEGTECSPARWTLEASHDGETWFVVDDKSASDAPNPGSHEAGYNGGEPFSFAASEGAAGATIPASSVVEVAAGATLDVVNAARAISKLRVDCSAGAGSICGFNPAAGGTLFLENAFELTPQGSVLPISIASSTNAANLATWSVFADGVKQTARFYINASGEACVKAKAGMILFFR